MSLNLCNAENPLEKQSQESTLIADAIWCVSSVCWFHTHHMCKVTKMCGKYRFARWQVTRLINLLANTIYFLLENAHAATPDKWSSSLVSLSGKSEDARIYKIIYISAPLCVLARGELIYMTCVLLFRVKTRILSFLITHSSRFPRLWANEMITFDTYCTRLKLSNNFSL